jgi:hypothetical protein
MEVAGAVAAWALAAVFAAAVGAKLRSPGDFAQTISGLAPRLAPVRHVVVTTVLALETGAAVALVLRPRVGAALAIGLLVAFAGVAGIVHATGRRVSCSCFGASGTLLGPVTTARNLALAAVAAIVIFAGTAAADLRDVRVAVAAALLVATVVTLQHGIEMALEIAEGLRRLESTSGGGQA